jgi:hypothetical protein
VRCEEVKKERIGGGCGGEEVEEAEVNAETKRRGDEAEEVRGGGEAEVVK